MKKSRKYRIRIILVILAPIIAGIFLLLNTILSKYGEAELPTSAETNMNEINISGGKFENIGKLRIIQENKYLNKKDTPRIFISDLTDDSRINDSGKINEVSNENNKKILKTNTVDDTLSNTYCKIEYTDKFQTRFWHTIHFFLSNPCDNGLLVVDSIELVVLEAKPFNLTYFPDGPWAPIPIYNYEIEINPTQKRYLINDREFSYKPTEIDKFSVLIKSKQNYLYKTRIDVKYFNPKKLNSKHLISSEEHLIPFAQRFSLDSIFAKAHKLDIFLNLYESIKPLFITNRIKYSDSCKIRYIFSESIKGRGAREFFDKSSYYRVSKNFNIIPDSLYQSVFNKEITYYESHKQFIIVNDSLLIHYISFSEGQLFIEKEIVNEYIKNFNKLYSIEFIPRENQLKFLTRELDIPPGSFENKEK